MKPAGYERAAFRDLREERLWKNSSGRDGVRTLRELALDSAARQYTLEDYEALMRDIDSGHAEIWLYDDGIVVMRDLTAK